MTPRERETAKKLSRVMSAARKKASFTQMAAAKELDVSQSLLSKMESGLLVPSAPLWMDFCRLVHISPSTLETGFIDLPRPMKLGNGPIEGLFRIPARYRENRGSKVRTLLPFLHFMESAFTEKQREDVFKQLRVDSDYFVDQNNELNMIFLLDLAQLLIEKGKLKPGHLSKLTQSVRVDRNHGSLGERYLANADKVPFERIKLLIDNAPYYECNYRYGVESETPHTLDISATPEPHLAEGIHRGHPLMGDFLCSYKESYFSQFAQGWGDRSMAGSVEVEHLECSFRGAPKCLFRFRQAA